MTTNLPDPNEKGWALSIGLYPGLLFGIRTYEEHDYNMHVLYIPFIELVLEIDK
jgi:hypothetical protein